jgi:hypothetical protein
VPPPGNPRWWWHALSAWLQPIKTHRSNKLTEQLFENFSYPLASTLSVTVSQGYWSVERPSNVKSVVHLSTSW